MITQHLQTNSCTKDILTFVEIVCSKFLSSVVRHINYLPALECSRAEASPYPAPTGSGLSLPVNS